MRIMKEYNFVSILDQFLVCDLFSEYFCFIIVLLFHRSHFIN